MLIDQAFFDTMTPKLKCDASNQDPQWQLQTCISIEDAKSIVTKEETAVVTFSHTVEENEIPSWREFSTEETADCWFSEEEYASIESSMRKEIAMLERGKILRNKKYCSRGLEQYLAKNAISKAANRQQGVSAVLQKQYDLRQVTDREYELDDIRIAEAYQGVSSSCHMWAAVIGLRDMRNAEKYLEDFLECTSEISSPLSICCAPNRPAVNSPLWHGLVSRAA
eukprot:scaffold11725_cov116-Cylindrotheca_fusiformis.AAC.9